jgi:hypothetical protein
MPLLCEFRLPPDNTWTMEEKVAWLDQDEEMAKWAEKE